MNIVKHRGIPFSPILHFYGQEEDRVVLVTGKWHDTKADQNLWILSKITGFLAKGKNIV